MSRPRRTSGREGVTRDTPLGGCHVLSRCPATAIVTYRDNVTFSHAVTPWYSWLKTKTGNHVSHGGSLLMPTVGAL